VVRVVQSCDLLQFIHRDCFSWLMLICSWSLCWMCPVFVCMDFNNIRSCKHYLCTLKCVNINTVDIFYKSRIISHVAMIAVIWVAVRWCKVDYDLHAGACRYRHIVLPAFWGSSPDMDRRFRFTPWTGSWTQIPLTINDLTWEHSRSCEGR